jgi:hypothetical protein
MTFFLTSTTGGVAWVPLVLVDVLAPLDALDAVVGAPAVELVGLEIATAEPDCEPADVHPAAVSASTATNTATPARFAADRPECDFMMLHSGATEPAFVRDDPHRRRTGQELTTLRLHCSADYRSYPAGYTRLAARDPAEFYGLNPLLIMRILPRLGRTQFRVS